ncbi:MAG: hypothetical protein JRE40_07265 [Deltaproteobacteria bacterium]|nr:hypothetical protein [Deltaproteobacteria bacterium]
MSLRVGDHLVIKRDGKLIAEEDEAYHEFEVMEPPVHYSAPDSKFQYKKRKEVAE